MAFISPLNTENFLKLFLQFLFYYLHSCFSVVKVSLYSPYDLICLMTLSCYYYSIARLPFPESLFYAASAVMLYRILAACRIYSRYYISYDGIRILSTRI